MTETEANSSPDLISKDRKHVKTVVKGLVRSTDRTLQADSSIDIYS